MAIIMQNLGRLAERLANLFFRPKRLQRARQYY
jgi:hypothetical protein